MFSVSFDQAHKSRVDPTKHRPHRLLLKYTAIMILCGWLSGAFQKEQMPGAATIVAGVEKLDFPSVVLGVGIRPC